MFKQQVCYFQKEKNIQELDIRQLFIIDLCKALGEMRDEKCHVVMGMDANDDVHNWSFSAALANVGINKAMINNHKGESVLATCVNNQQRKLIGSIWTSPGLDVLCRGFLPFHDVYGFDLDNKLIWVEIYN